VKRNLLTLALGVAVLGLPGSAAGAACSPLNCAPSQFTLGHGALLGFRGSVDKPLRVIDLQTGATRWYLPAGIVAGDRLVHQDGALVTWFNAADGKRVAYAVLAVHGTFALVGTSQDGEQAVLARTQARSTTFAIVSHRASRIVKLGGNHWSFDALRGTKLFLIRTLGEGYQVRLVDLATNKLVTKTLRDPRESATIAGLPFARVPSPDGRYLFTLYLGAGGGAMIHELDLVAGTAHCIDLPGNGNFAAATTWALVADPDGRTLWAVAPGYGRVVALDVRAHRIRGTWSFSAGSWTQNAAGTVVLSPDGAHFALTDASHVWLIALEPRLSVRRLTHVAIGLAWSPDQRHLWAVGLRSRVSSLPVR
jgi:hypothetical protein